VSYGEAMKNTIIIGLLVAIALAVSVVAFNTTQSNHREQVAADAKAAAVRQTAVEHLDRCIATEFGTTDRIKCIVADANHEFDGLPRQLEFKAMEGK
jgi:flagellar basal body-associated protein FliL